MTTMRMRWSLTSLELPETRYGLTMIARWCPFGLVTTGPGLPGELSLLNRSWAVPVSLRPISEDAGSRMRAHFREPFAGSRQRILVAWESSFFEEVSKG
jgi:hypothetical protein